LGRIRYDPADEREERVMSTFAGKVAIVTGGASGIGEATSALLAQRGAAVVVADISADRAEAVAAAITAAGGTAIAAVADVADEAQVAAMVALAQRELGGVDILHNNAALVDAETLGQDGPIADADPELWARVLSVNVIGYVLAAKHAVPAMLARGGGVIVNTTSGTGLQAELGRPAYGTSKAAIVGLTRNIATQYGRQGIRSVALALGLVGTPALKANMPQPLVDGFLQHQLVPRLIEPQDVAQAVAFVASDEAQMITGTTIVLDGGFSSHTPTYAVEVAAAG
jgi:NAD(P)-dependent dehydrogenase (short-subunit alcohol dehydrogenase family)